EHRGYTREFEEIENSFLDERDPQQTSADRFKAHSLKTGRVAVAFIAGHDAAAGDLRHDRRKQISSGVSLSWFRQAANELVLRELIQQFLHARRHPQGRLHEG